MAELDKIPQKQSIEIEIAKLDEDVIKNITELKENNKKMEDYIKKIIFFQLCGLVLL